MNNVNFAEIPPYATQFIHKCEGEWCRLSYLPNSLFGTLGQKLMRIADSAQSIGPSAGSLKNLVVDWY